VQQALANCFLPLGLVEEFALEMPRAEYEPVPAVGRLGLALLQEAAVWCDARARPIMMTSRAGSGGRRKRSLCSTNTRAVAS
jgi:hypothetical protein